MGMGAGPDRRRPGIPAARLRTGPGGPDSTPARDSPPSSGGGPFYKSVSPSRMA